MGGFRKKHLIVGVELFVADPSSCNFTTMQIQPIQDSLLYITITLNHTLYDPKFFLNWPRT